MKLGVQSHVAVSFESSECTADVDALRYWDYAKDYVRMQWMLSKQHVLLKQHGYSVNVSAE